MELNAQVTGEREKNVGGKEIGFQRDGETIGQLGFMI